MHIQSKRKRIHNQELASRFHLSRPTINAYIEAFNKRGKPYDPRDINSVFDFYDYLTNRREAKIKALQGITEENQE
jgi:Winged helix-turn-helix DNA-binding